MIHKNIRLLHDQIGFTLKWNWFLFLAANLIFIVLFILVNFLNLKNSSVVWKEFFLDRLVQVEKVVEGGSSSSSIPVTHTLTIGADGTIRKAPTPLLQGMSLNVSGFFGKIFNLQPGQIAIIFFPDMVDGVQRVHFIKRYADEFIVNSFAPKDFFPIDLFGKTHLSVVTGNVIWFSDDTSEIGNIHKKVPIFIYSGRLFISFEGQIPQMPDARLVITQDVTVEFLIMFLTASILILAFSSFSLRTRRIQKDFSVLQDEHKGMTQLIQTLSSAILQPDENVSDRLGKLAPALLKSFQDTEKMPLQFEEYQQYQLLLQTLIDNILVLVDKVKKDGEQLRESAEKFRQIFDESPIGIEIYDSDGCLLQVNRACLDIFGVVDPGEIRGFKLFDDPNLPSNAHDLLLHNGMVLFENAFSFDLVRAEHLYQTQKSGTAYLKTFITALPGSSSGTAQGYLVQIQDITVRIQAEVAQHDSEERYHTLAGATFEAIVITEKGVILDVNPQFLHRWGFDMSEVLGRHISEFVIPEDAAIMRKVIADGKEVIREYCANRKDGTPFFIEAHGREIERSQHRLRITSIRNISELKQAEYELKESEERFRTLFEQAPIGILIMRDGTLIYGNQWLINILGLEGNEDFISRPAFEYFAPQFQEESKERIRRRRMGLPVPTHIETILLKKDGTPISVEIVSAQISLPDGQALVGFVADITERKHAREGLENSLQQLHALSIHLQTIREDERASISREIHDELGQALTGLKMELYLLKEMQSKNAGAENFALMDEKLTSALKDVDLTIDGVRKMATSLRPSILDTLGLAPALEWLAHDFEIRSGNPCLFKTNIDQEYFHQGFTTAAFRICQESLTNVARHAHASRVNVHLFSKNDQILLEVEDNGIGINEKEINLSNSLGIMGMKERAYAFNGSVDLKNLDTGGTRVTARFPKTDVFRPNN